MFCKCHRYEPAGTMHGLMRVRGFVQDDAHIFCTEEQIASEVADFCALVKESVQAECRDKMLAFWHDRGAAADAKGVKSTTTIQEPSVATGCLQTVITEAKREALAPFGFDDIVVKFSTRPEKRVGSDELWDKAEAALEEATKLAGLDYVLNPGEGAFYGPKSVQNECRRKMLAFFYDRVQPRTPSASTSNSP